MKSANISSDYIQGTSVAIFCGDKVLLAQRKNPPRQYEWSIPGGHVEANESLEQAACREIWEETGLNLAEKSLKYSKTIHFKISPEEAYEINLFIYEIEGSRPNVTAGDDAKAIGWYNENQLPQLDISKDTLELLQSLFANRIK
jgi:8-oxo-dGTP diphosphatase